MAEASEDEHALISQFRDLTGSTTEEVRARLGEEHTPLLTGSSI